MLFRVKQVRNLFLFILPLIAIAGTNAHAEQIAPTFSQKLDIVTIIVPTAQAANNIDCVTIPLLPLLLRGQ